MPEMQQRQFHITNISVIGVPEGLIAVPDKALSVVIGGPAVLMRKLTSDMIVVTVDCTNQNLRPNESKIVRVSITIVGMEGVSPVQDYWVNLKVTEEGALPEA